MTTRTFTRTECGITHTWTFFMNTGDIVRISNTDELGYIVDSNHCDIDAIKYHIASLLKQRYAEVL